MGAVYNILAIRVTNRQRFADFTQEYGIAPPSTEQFVVVNESRDYPDDLTKRDWGAAEPARRFGEAIFLYYYDGGAGELCGTILYEHAVAGEVVRALGYGPPFWDDPEPDPERLMWRRVDGVPEAWEAAVFDFSAAELAEALREAADYGSPPAAEVEALWATGTLQEGQYFPAQVQDRVLGGVRRAFQLW